MAAADAAVASTATAANNPKCTGLIASAAQMVPVPNTHGDIQIQNSNSRGRGGGSCCLAPVRVRGFFPGGFFGIAREGFGCFGSGSAAADLPNWTTPAQMDASATWAARPLPRLGFAGGVAAGTRRTVDLPGSVLTAGEHFRPSESIPSGSTTRKGPNIDIQLGRCRPIPSLLLLLLLLVSILLITRDVLLLTLLENAPPLGRG